MYYLRFSRRAALGGSAILGASFALTPSASTARGREGVGGKEQEATESFLLRTCPELRFVELAQSELVN